MTTKERILALLEENRGTPLSGEVLAEELGVSRTAVWKAIKDRSQDSENMYVFFQKVVRVFSKTRTCFLEGLGM